MPNLRSMIDGKIFGAATPPKPKPAQDADDDPSDLQQAGKPYPSPAGQHVASNIQDPYGTTKDELDELNQAKLNYEMKKAQMQMKLQPVKSVVDGISQMHEMQDPNQSPDANMGYSDPNDPMGGNMAMSPQGGAQPGAMPPQAGAMPPQNGPMPGMPGVPPGQPKEAIRPLKLGVPSPGMAMPGQVAGNPGAQMNPQAAKPAGAGSMPGANGPGAPKVQNQIKKSQSGGKSGSGKSGGSSSSGKVAIHVHADSVSSSPAKRTLSSYAGSDALRSASHSCDACGEKMKAYGTSEGVHKEWETRGHGYKGAPNQGRDRIQESWQRKNMTKEDATRATKQALRENMSPEQWQEFWGNLGGKKKLNAYGTSQGVEKEWQTRQRGSTDPQAKSRYANFKPGSHEEKREASLRERMANKTYKTPADKGTIKVRDYGFNAYGTSEGVRKEWESRGRGRKEPIVDINDKRGFNAPIDKKKVSPGKSSEKKSNWFPGPAGWANDLKSKSMTGGVFKSKKKY